MTERIPDGIEIEALDQLAVRGTPFKHPQPAREVWELADAMVRVIKQDPAAFLAWFRERRPDAGQQLASRGAPLAVTRRCSCPGCWACSGGLIGCTCDVDWDELAERRMGQRD